MGESGHVSQWAILPAMVRYDRTIPPNAKLIYAEIAAKINADGYCFCHNRYFAERFGIKEDTVSSLVKRLEKAEYIIVDVNSKEVNAFRRRIFLTGKPYNFGIGFKSDTRRGKKTDTPPEKNPIPIENNNIKTIIPPIAPQTGDGDPPKGKGKGKREPKKVADWKPERFEAFWKYYPPVNGKRPAKSRAINAWDKLRPDDETIARMGRALQRDMKSKMWLSGIGIPYASSWLNQRCWEDEVVTEDEERNNAYPTETRWAADPEVM